MGPRHTGCQHQGRMKLTPFHGHLKVQSEGVRDEQIQNGVRTGFRQQLIELVHAGRSANDVVKEFGLHATTVAKWVRLSSMGTSVAMGQWPEIMSRKGRA